MTSEIQMFVRHDEDYATAGQLAPEQMSALAEMGFRTVIDHRPDGEGGPGQPTADALRAAAEAAGLRFVYQPITAIDLESVQAFAAHLQSLPRPVLAFCASGGRSTMLYRYVQAGLGARR